MHDVVYDNICQIIRRTPIVRLNRLPKHKWLKRHLWTELFS
jgi:hypothetical protein